MLNKSDWTTILQTLENELRITTGVDEQDRDSELWAKELRKVIKKVEKCLK